MNRVVRTGIALAVATGSLSSPRPAYTQQTGTRSAFALFAELYEATGSLQERLRAKADEKLATGISAVLDSLLDRWQAAGAPQLGPEYLESLEASNEALRQFLTDTLTAIESLIDVYDDLHTKARFAYAGPGAGAGFRQTVAVTVTTTGDQGPLNGFLINANPKRYGTRQPARFAFNAPTTPRTTSQLPPGNYTVWAERPQGIIVAKRSVTIGALMVAVDSVTILIAPE